MERKTRSLNSSRFLNQLHSSMCYSKSLSQNQDLKELAYLSFLISHCRSTKNDTVKWHSGDGYFIVSITVLPKTSLFTQQHRPRYRYPKVSLEDTAGMSNPRYFCSILSLCRSIRSQPKLFFHTVAVKKGCHIWTQGLCLGWHGAR